MFFIRFIILVLYSSILFVGYICWPRRGLESGCSINPILKRVVAPNKPEQNHPGDYIRGDSTMNLDTLPEALVLEICDYLDIFSAVALSEVNRTLNTMSKSSKAWWLHVLAQSELFIPLPTHRPLHSYTAAELYLAGHRAGLTERNVTSNHPRLHASRYIQWPYEPSPGVALLTGIAKDESAEEAIHMHLAHPNGNWMFTVSSQNVLRILHLRSGKLALAYDGEIFDRDRDIPSLVAWAVEFKEEEKASLVMNCQFWDGSEQIWRPAIRLFHVDFDDEHCRATIQYVGHRLMNTMPTHLDIAGGYIVAVENSKWPYDAGTVCLIRWDDMQSIPLPELYPSVRIAAFQEYFISVGVALGKSTGVSYDDRIHLQVVGYPPNLNDSASCRSLFQPEESEATRSMFGQLTLGNKTGKLALHTYAIPFDGPLFLGGVPFSSFICHFYTGERNNPIKLWVRPGRSGAWTVFPIQLDLTNLRSSAIRAMTQRAYEGETLRKEFVVTGLERQLILEEKHLVHWAAPVASGRRFIWWRPVNQLRTTEEEAEGSSLNVEDKEPDEKFRLFLSVIDNLAGMDQWDAEPDLMLDSTQQYDETSAAGKQLREARQLEIPPELAYSPGQVYMFVMEEWSGTIVVQMYAGDLWVLRYGKKA